MKKPVFCLFVLGFIFSVFKVNAQNSSTKRGDLYFSWGYNTEWYTRSNLHIKQPGLNNDYTFTRIKAHDRVGWDQQLFKKGLTIPQYNYRLGYFFNQEKGWGIEINFDHTKYVVEEGQDAVIRGKLNDKMVDTAVSFVKDDGFYYFLNNGANFLLFNLVKSQNLFSTKDGNLRLQFLGKAGIGPVIPHVENSLFGNANKPHFQLGGWNAGVEAALKASFFRYMYLEYSNKLDYARYSNLKIYEGTAKQAFGTYEMVLSLGANLPL